MIVMTAIVTAHCQLWVGCDVCGHSLGLLLFSEAITVITAGMNSVGFFPSFLFILGCAAAYGKALQAKKEIHAMYHENIGRLIEDMERSGTSETAVTCAVPQTCCKLGCELQHAMHIALGFSSCAMLSDRPVDAQ